MTAKATVARKDLAQAIEDLLRMLGRKKKKAGDAAWKFTPEGIVVLWGNLEQVVPARVTEAGAIEVDGAVMQRLVEALPAQEELAVSGDGRRLQIGSFVIGANKAVPNVPPIDATDLDLLTFSNRLSVSERRALNLEARHNAASDRLAEAVRTSARLLAPFGVQEIDLLRYVLETMRSR